MSKKVIIGITTGNRKINSFTSPNAEFVCLSNAYLQLFKHDENVIPLIISPEIYHNNTEQICSMLDGLIISDGQDIHPSYYKQINLVKYDENVKGIGVPFKRPKVMEPYLQRDQLEIQLYRKAKEKNIPILGVCRGMQIINVAEGGTLHQELPDSEVTHYLGEDGWINYHQIKICQSSKLNAIFKKEEYAISSIHHQGIEKLGKELIATGHADDGHIEVIEHKDKDFIMGFQGHFEKMVKNYPLYQKMIHHFVEQARKEVLCS